MFKKSDTHTQLDVFSSPTEYFTGPTRDFYLKNDSWHNQFRKEVLMRIDEAIFSPLFCANNGAPNAAIRILVGLMILKEGQGWSDEQLFENAKYNALLRRALGLDAFSDSLPVLSTYYLFRCKMIKYNEEHGVDLMKECMDKITHGQMLDFNVSGKRVRMDSKLINSNIANYSRYELIHEIIRLFIEERKDSISQYKFTKEELSLIERIRGEEGNKVVYRSTKAEINSRLVELGNLMFRFIRLFQENDYGRYQTLKTVFEQQYRLGKSKKVILLDNDQISAKSIQSPHDTDCHYRKKKDNKVKGYAVNVTETCERSREGEKPALNLITDVEVDVVSTADSSFLQEAIEKTQEIVNDKIEKVYADGAYNSEINQEYCRDNNIDLQLTGIQGAIPRYDIHLDEKDEENLIVTDRETGKPVQAQRVKPRKETAEKKWKIKTEAGKWKYFGNDSLKAAALRQKLKEMPPEESTIRNNVEASIFQLGYHYSNDKSRYRTLAKHKLWAYSRSMWVNLRRIVKYQTQICQRPLFGQKLHQHILKLCFNMYNIVNMFFNIKNNIPQKKFFIFQRS